MPAVKSHFIRVIVFLALLAVTATAACVVRSRPAHDRRTVVHHHDHGRGPVKHKKQKKHKKHKKHH